jgi:hypothetical protein
LGADEFAKLGRMLSRECGVVYRDRSPHERSDMRVCRNPAYRFAHAGYRLSLAMTMLKHEKSTGSAAANSTFALICAMIAVRRRANN